MSEPALAQRRAPNLAHKALRSRTRADHDAVDAAYSRFDLADHKDYAALLTAHARVLPALETRLAPAELLPDWTGRSEALLADLAQLGIPAPVPIDIELPDGTAARWGALYVLEGSLLGGVVLARQIGDRLPHAYLSAAHRPGAWQALLISLDTACEGSAWRDNAVSGARLVFAAFQAAARPTVSG